MDRLDENARARVHALVGAYEQMSQVERSVALYELVARSPSRQLSAVLNHIEQVIRVDFLQRLPRDLAMRILAYLDAPSLGRIAQVSRHWKELAEDDQLWRRMCIQHIGHRCSKCGWGLSTLSLKTINQYKAENKNLRYKALYAEKHRIARNWKVRATQTGFSLP